MKVLMTRIRMTAAVLLPTLALAWTPSLFAADKKPAAEDSKPAVKKPRAEPRGPIPSSYGKFIAPDQKDAIYQIQLKYEAQLSPLQQQVKDLMAKRDAEIEATLTPEQRAKVAAAKAEAKAKASAAKKPADKKPAATETTKTEKPAETK